MWASISGPVYLETQVEELLTPEQFVEWKRLVQEWRPKSWQTLAADFDFGD
jgi:hypothetical protein